MNGFILLCSYFHNLLLVWSIFSYNVHIINLFRLLARKAFVHCAVISIKGLENGESQWYWLIVQIHCCWWSELILLWKTNLISKFFHLWWSQHFSHIVLHNHVSWYPPLIFHSRWVCFFFPKITTEWFDGLAKSIEWSQSINGASTDAITYGLYILQHLNQWR